MFRTRDHSKEVGDRNPMFHTRDRLNACVFFASNLHVEMGRAISEAIISKHFEIFNILAESFASYSGRAHFRKAHPKTKINPHIVFHWISVNSVTPRNLAKLITWSWSGTPSKLMFRAVPKICIRARNSPPRRLQTQKHCVIRRLRDPNPMEEPEQDSATNPETKV